MSFKLLGAIPALSIVAGCNTVNKNIGMDDPGMGEAVRYNVAVQTINPDPVYSEDGAQPGDNGARGAAAVKRYRLGQMNARHNSEAHQGSAISTTSGSSGGPQ